jgi:hypothetical protein
VTENENDTKGHANPRKLGLDSQLLSGCPKYAFPPKLTRRESEVLPLLLLGATREEIAVSLSVSPETVKLHTRNVLKKFNANSVREGFHQMDLYQTHYGQGGQGSDRFENLFQCVCQVLPGRKDVRLTNKLNVTIMQDELSEFKFSYFANGTLTNAVAPGNMLQGPEVYDQAVTFRVIPGTALKKFDCYKYSFAVTFKDEFHDNSGVFMEQATYPAQRREYIIEFDPGDVPDRIQYDALSGTHVMDNYDLDVVTKGPRLSIIDRAPRVPMGIRVKWEWTAN